VLFDGAGGHPDGARASAAVGAHAGSRAPAQRRRQPTIQRIDLETEGDVADIDEDHFREHAEEAKAGCPVSRALAGVEEIELSARLASA